MTRAPLFFCLTFATACADDSADDGAVDSDVAAVDSDVAAVDSDVAAVDSDVAAVDSDDTHDIVEVTPAPPRPPVVVTWEPCDFLGDPSDLAACATVEVPLSTRDPEQRTIPLFVKRLRADPAVTPDDGPRRALWLLMGGPGQAGADGEGLVGVLAARDPGLDFYLIDHRGTGRSDRISCPSAEHPFSNGGESVQPDEWPSCARQAVDEWGDALAYYSTTEAAYDLQSLIDAIHADADQVFLLGVSYGTYLAQRYLALFPDGAGVDAVALDSICAADGCVLSQSDLWEDEVAHQILDLCPDDPDCSKYYPPDGPTVWQSLGTLYDRIAAGHCPLSDSPELDVQLLRVHLGMLMFNYGGRRLVPALVRRYLRCDPGDVAAIRHSFVTNLGFDPAQLGSAAMPVAPPAAAVDNLAFSWPLGVNILVSELWGHPGPTIDQIESYHAAARSTRGAALNAGHAAEVWPRYDEPLEGQWPTFAVPVLAMNADWDPATPARYARAIAAHLPRPDQTYVEIPGHGHTVIAQGQLIDDPSTTCGRELLLQFLADPGAPLDTGCLARSLPMQFKMRPAAVRYWLGADDLWDDAAPITPGR